MGWQQKALVCWRQNATQGAYLSESAYIFFCKSQLPHKFVNLSFIIADRKHLGGVMGPGTGKELRRARGQAAEGSCLLAPGCYPRCELWLFASYLPSFEVAGEPSLKRVSFLSGRLCSNFRGFSHLATIQRLLPKTGGVCGESRGPGRGRSFEGYLGEQQKALACWRHDATQGASFDGFASYLLDEAGRFFLHLQKLHHICPSFDSFASLLTRDCGSTHFKTHGFHKWESF